MLNAKNIDLAFGEKSKVYDIYSKENFIVKYSRYKIRNEMLQYLNKNDKILELNGGTGSDALYFVKRGYFVHLTDISTGMVKKSRSKINKKFQDRFIVEKKSFTKISELPKNSYDYIFSNFGGLNCIYDVKSVINQFPHVLKHGGHVTLVIMPPICPWELFNIFWNPSMAIRRIPAIFGKPIKANVAGYKFWVYYHSLNFIKGLFDSRFDILSCQSLSLFMPPSYLDYFPKKYPELLKRLIKIENRFSKFSPFNKFGDFFVITLKYN
jgi:ubiquinone/menaquinone biosynthesis C-methylase UbiE